MQMQLQMQMDVHKKNKYICNSLQLRTNTLQHNTI